MRYIFLRLKRFCGFISGFVFFLSGIFKLLDPVGSGLIMSEYFHFLNIPFLDGIAKESATLIAFIETIVGAALITGIWRRLGAVAALVMQVFFTILSILLVKFNPDMDCGCFGEVIHLTHMETLMKNIVLLLLICLYVFPLKSLGRPRKKKYVSFGLVTSATIAFTFYSWISIPLIDFTEYKPASVLKESNEFPTSEEDLYEVTLTYEKNGVRKIFSLDEIPDTTWTFIESQTRLKKEYGGSVIDLSFYDSNGDYYDRLAAEGKVMAVSVYDVNIMDKRWEVIAGFLSDARKAGFRPLLLTAATDTDIKAIYGELDTEVRRILTRCTYFADRKTLVTLNRSNGGVTFFSEGYLIRKWAARERPDLEQLKKISAGDDTEMIIGDSTNHNLAFEGFLLIIFAIMLLL